MIQLAANDWLFDQLMTFDAGSEDLEDGSDAEDDGSAVLRFDRAPARWSTRAAVVRQPVPPADRRAGHDGLRLGGTVSPAGQSRASPARTISAAK